MQHKNEKPIMVKLTRIQEHLEDICGGTHILAETIINPRLHSAFPVLLLFDCLIA